MLKIYFLSFNRANLSTFLLKDELLINENDEKPHLKLEKNDYPISVFEEMIKIIKSACNYLNTYSKQNYIPSPQQISPEKQV